MMMRTMTMRQANKMRLPCAWMLEYVYRHTICGLPLAANIHIWLRTRPGCSGIQIQDEFLQTHHSDTCGVPELPMMRLILTIKTELKMEKEFEDDKMFQYILTLSRPYLQLNLLLGSTKHYTPRMDTQPRSDTHTFKFKDIGCAAQYMKMLAMKVNPTWFWDLHTSYIAHSAVLYTGDMPRLLLSIHTRTTEKTEMTLML